MPINPPTYAALTHIRLFHSTSSCLAKSTRARLAHDHASIPPYPYGPSQIYKQSNFGLYGTSKIRFGNMVSERNEIKTRRFWRPNVQQKKLWSDALQTWVRTRVTARVLRTIDKVGGLDEYLLGNKAARIKELGMGGWRLRWRVMQTGKVKERIRREKEALGLESSEEIVLGIDGGLVSEEARIMAVEAFDKELARGGVLGIGDKDEIGDVVEDGEAGDDFMKENDSRNERRVLL